MFGKGLEKKAWNRLGKEGLKRLGIGFKCLHCQIEKN